MASLFVVVCLTSRSVLFNLPLCVRPMGWCLQCPDPWRGQIRSVCLARHRSWNTIQLSKTDMATRHFYYSQNQLGFIFPFLSLEHTETLTMESSHLKPQGAGGQIMYRGCAVHRLRAGPVTWGQVQCLSCLLHQQHVFTDRQETEIHQHAFEDIFICGSRSSILCSTLLNAYKMGVLAMPRSWVRFLRIFI